MKIELALDRAGLWWSGLGFSLHIAREARADGEPVVWGATTETGARRFRLGAFEGVMGRQ